MTIEHEGMTSDYVLVTPELAAEALKRNATNRPMKEANIQWFAREIREGRFATTHQGICIDAKGNLQDGQHRCAAIVRTGQAQTMLVTRGAPIEHYNRIDTGAKRSTLDLVAMAAPIRNVKHVVAVAGLAWHWDQGSAVFQASGRTIRDHHILEMLKRYPALVDAPRVAMDKSTGIPPGMASFMAFIANDEEFVASMTSEAFGDPDPIDPAAVLVESYRLRIKGNTATTPKLRMAMFIKARNDRAKGPLAKVPKRYSGRTTDAFPVPAWDPPIVFGEHAEPEQDA